MWLTKLFTILFLGGAAFNLYKGDLANAGAGFIIGIMLGSIVLYFQREGRNADEFEEWIMANRDALGQGSALYEGRAITLETEVTRFEACLSFLFISTK